MKKKNLLSIGELSKITGVHIKALRYYDSLGILPPAFVDPESGYRYYSFCQKAIVDAIRFCIELDIPLKQFPDYTSKAYANETGPWICYRELVERGTALAEEKIQLMQKRLHLLKAMEAEIERSERSCQSNCPGWYALPERTCCITPYEGRFDCDESRQLMKQLIMEIYEHGASVGNSSGLLLRKEKDGWKQYLFVDMEKNAGKTAEHPGMMQIPAGQYLCRKVEHSGIRQVWDWCLPYVSESDIKLVIETELFVGNYAFSTPVLEQRCLLDV